MSKQSHVLSALKILGLEEMLKLSEVLHVKQVPLKKAAGEELIVWDDAPEEPLKKDQSAAKVLDFPTSKRTLKEVAPPLEEKKEGSEKEGDASFLGTDVVLWQREIAKSSEETIHKLDAFKGYRRSSEMYVVKTTTDEGKEKISFASTNGILVNKKQA